MPGLGSRISCRDPEEGRKLRKLHQKWLSKQSSFSHVSALQLFRLCHHGMAKDCSHSSPEYFATSFRIGCLQIKLRFRTHNLFPSRILDLPLRWSIFDSEQMHILSSFSVLFLAGSRPSCNFGLAASLATSQARIIIRTYNHVWRRMFKFLAAESCSRTIFNLNFAGCLLGLLMLKKA